MHLQDRTSIHIADPEVYPFADTEEETTGVAPACQLYITPENAEAVLMKANLIKERITFAEENKLLLLLLNSVVQHCRQITKTKKLTDALEAK